MVAVSMDYRLKDLDAVEVPLECVKDAKSAIRFLRKNAEGLKLDSGRIVVAGDSAGGQLAVATAMITGPNSDEQQERAISCMPNAVILYNPYFMCQEDLSPPFHVKPGLPPFITFLGDQDSAITGESLLAFHNELIAAGIKSEFYVGKGGKHGFCNGRNPYNEYFCWSLELEDRFLVEQGLLSGHSLEPAVPGWQRRITGGDRQLQDCLII